MPKDAKNYCRVKDLPLTTPKKQKPRDIIHDFTLDISPKEAMDVLHELYVFWASKNENNSIYKDYLTNGYNAIRYHLKAIEDMPDKYKFN